MSIFRHWPELSKEIEEQEYDCWMTYYKHNGEHIYGPRPPSFNDPENAVGRRGPHVAFMHSRVKLMMSLLRQVEKLGLRVEYGKNVVDYFEDEKTKIGSVVLGSGEKLKADVVIAADGIKTRSGKIVSGRDIHPRESGMAIYRCAYPVEHALTDPTVRQRWNREESERPIWEFWLG